MKNLVPCVLLMGGVALPSALAQENNSDDEALQINQEADSYAIAEQLYAQSRGASADPASRRASLQRAAALFGDFVKKFPQSSNVTKALYLQAVCLAESGDESASNKVLATLANTKKGEYAAAAAYKLGTLAFDRHLWDKALGFYQITVRETKRDDLLTDATYRIARTQLQMGRRDEAESSFRRLLVLQNVQPALVHAGVMALAQMKTEDGKDAEAYAFFLRLISMPDLDVRMQGTATLQAARLASRLGKTNEAQQHYSKLAQMPGMEKYAGEAQMESLITLYKNKDYEGVVKQVTTSYTQLEDSAKEARRALIVGQSYMELKRYDAAAEWFDLVEKAQPDTKVAADAAYRHLICAQQLRSTNFFAMAQKYLSTYAAAGKPTSSLPCNDLVRLMYADRMMLADIAEAARQFDAINFEHLPESVRPDAEYKKAWCASQGDAYDPLPTLNHFIDTYKQNQRLPEALALRGACLMKQNKIGPALADFDRVIKEFPTSEAAPVCWQRAAQACAQSDPKRMVSYYEGLIACGTRVKPAAIAEAHYYIARALYEAEPAKAIPHFQEARTLNAERYGSLVDLSLVQCYFKLQDAEKLREALITLQSSNPASYNALPAAILRWCGWMCFQNRNYLDADKYLSEALPREPREKYTAPDGAELERPKVEPLVWKTLARARLELRQYQRGLEAAEHYVQMEQQPYRKAEGMRDMSQLLVGLNRAAEARKLCEDAIALGIDGPIKFSVFIALGDAYYVEGNYAEAAKYYGRTANVVSDKELKPIALYKIVSALKLSDKAGEAVQYEENLRTEFPGWVPPANVLLLMNASNKNQ
ncbi:MAG: tetratricopeptide repeat protein [Akkermansia sp.]|nr:tetratricopeptide repeat protein [Akkermansia sp.]